MYIKNFLKTVISLVLVLVVLAKTEIGVCDSRRGKVLFKEKQCLLCHNIELPGTKFKPICPGLSGVRNRHEREWLKKWLADPTKVWKTNDAHVRDINRRYYAYRASKPQPRESFMGKVIGKTVHLSQEEINDLIDYLLTL